MEVTVLDPHENLTEVVLVDELQPLESVLSQAVKAFGFKQKPRDYMLRTPEGEDIDDDDSCRQLESGDTVLLVLRVARFLEELENGAHLEDLPVWAQCNRACRIAALQRHERTIARNSGLDC